MNLFEKLESWLIEIAGEGSLWMIEVFLIVFLTLLLGYLTNKMFNRLEIQAAKTKNLWDDAIVQAGRRPIVWAVWILGINMAISVSAHIMDTSWYEIVAPLNRVAFIFVGAMFMLRLSRRVERNLIHPDYMEEPLDETTVRAVGKLVRVSIIISGILIAMQAFGYSISGVLAFGGVGGLAVGLAAKDLLANFFGGMMIYMDRPFKVGDWVRSPDKEIEGVVEEIGWRLTRIRTFDKRPLYIPNAIFNSISVENPSRMLNRRIYETVGIRYDDIHCMEAIVSKVRAMLGEHADIDQRQTLIVNFNAFSASSVDFFVYAFTKTIDWIQFHAVKQDVLLKIAAIVTEEGAEIAFPTSTVHLPDPVTLLQQAEKDA